MRSDIGLPYVALIFAIVLGIVRGVRVWVYSSVAAAWVLGSGSGSGSGAGAGAGARGRVRGGAASAADRRNHPGAGRVHGNRGGHPLASGAFCRAAAHGDARGTSAEQRERVRIGEASVVLARESSDDLLTVTDDGSAPAAS
ncbi:hypothetical protein E3O21_12325 [Cryobacterium flavum]|uniref:Uncharacterized protein n=1 Tax=Cryobacterium flavum TaxID=1424659 RepID=A0ABY2I2V8_9MICO|nr:hypothetical protein [Cryobacterium flavum]TFB75601.1 hypothetical protein E3O21_12325 [Cryobacterium flavum]